MTKETGLRAADIATLLYLGVVAAAVLMFSGGDHTGRLCLSLANVLAIALVFLAPRAREQGPLGAFLGDWYPIILLPALYAEVGVVNLDVGYHHDLAIQHLEQWIFGSQLSYEWIRDMPNPVLSWVLHSCYLAYYAILLASPLGLWVTGRRDSARFTIFAVVTTFYLCYVTFLFFPVAGPRYIFAPAHNAASDVWPARVAHWLLDRGDAWGAAFPSSHVAGAVVATLCALWFWRPLGLALVPWTTGLVFAVVYGQFHYAADSLAGLLVASGVFTSLIAGASRVRAAAPQPAAELESPTLPL